MIQTIKSIAYRWSFPVMLIMTYAIIGGME